MTAATMVPQVLDYLYAACQQSPLLGQASPAVAVYDGPNPTTDALASQRLLWIGYDPQNPGMEAATIATDWPVLDFARTEDEDAEITCAAEYWSGSTVMKANRDACAAIVEAVADLLRGTPGTGGPGDTTMGGLVFWSRVTAAAWGQVQKDDGVSVVCVFKVQYRARLVTT